MDVESILCRKIAILLLKLTCQVEDDFFAGL